MGQITYISSVIPIYVISRIVGPNDSLHASWVVYRPQLSEDSQFTEDDVRHCIRLIADVAMMEGDLAEMKSSLMDGLCNLIGADKWGWAIHVKQEQQDPQDARMIILHLLVGGFVDGEVKHLIKAYNDPDFQVADHGDLNELKSSESLITGKSERITPETYQRVGKNGRHWKAAGIENIIFSGMPLDNGVYSTIGVYRNQGRDEFTEREAKIVDVVLSEVEWLHRQDFPENRRTSFPYMAPQLKAVLNLLLLAHDRKSIAAELDLSPNTISGYVKEIYKLLRVNSQAQLISKFYQGNRGNCD